MIPTGKLKILRADYFDAYRQQLPIDLKTAFPVVPEVTFTADTFGFYTSVSSVYSSKIEGEPIELDSYLKHKFQKVKYVSDYTKKTDDLFNAYQFAQKHPLDFKNLLEAHSLLTKNILSTSARGRIRTQPEFILDNEGRIEYVAAPPDIVKQETKKLFADIRLLLKTNLKIEEVFYFASMIHLVFLKIHPMQDGNGRTSRLLEKWFLAEKLGENAWFIQSERFYYRHLADYYRNVHLGLEYETVNYDRCLPLLLMLPASLIPAK